MKFMCQSSVEERGKYCIWPEIQPWGCISKWTCIWSNTVCQISLPNANFFVKNEIQYWGKYSISLWWSIWPNTVFCFYRTGPYLFQFSWLHNSKLMEKSRINRSFTKIKRKENAKIRPQYPRVQRPLYMTRCQIFSSNVTNTGFVQTFGPTPVGSTSKKTLYFHCGCCKMFATPALLL